jgi:Flp pilus assembly protein TadG
VRARASRGEHGNAVLEVTWLAILLLVPLVYLLLAVFSVQRAAFGVNAATRAAARAYTLAPDEREGAARARAAAEVALEDQGLHLSQTTMSTTCDPEPGNCLSPGSVVHVHLACRVKLPLVPDALGGNAPSIRVDGEHSVPYGSFREDRS